MCTGDGEVASGVEEEDQGFDWQIDQQLPPSEDEVYPAY